MIHNKSTLECSIAELIVGVRRRTGHNGVSEVVLAMLIILHVFPFEGVAPATACSSGPT